MSHEILTDDSKGISNAVKVNFMTCAQFLALKQHFEDVIKDIKHDEDLRRLRVEFTKLLNVFESCYEENQRKVNKIHELQALVTIPIKEVKSVNFMQEAMVMDLKDTITHLQTDLDNAVDQRKLLEKIQDLKKTVTMQNKIIQVHTESLEKIPKSAEMDSNFKRINDGTVLKQEIMRSLGEEIKKKNYTNVAESKALKNNLEILLADLKLSREIIVELKTEIRARDVTVEDLRKDLGESEEMWAQAQNKIGEIEKTLKKKLDKYKTESEENRKKYGEVSKQLEKLVALSVKLRKDISSKNSIIEELKVKIADTDLEKESACRRTEIFENHLADNQTYVEKMKLEVKFLREEVESLKKQIPKETKETSLGGDKEKNVGMDAQERTIESLKNHIALRDKKLSEMGEELKTTMEILQGVKKDFNRTNARKISLEAEVQEMKKRLKEKNENLKQLKETFYKNQKELAEIKRELQSRVKKYQQAMDTKNKFHSICNRLKSVNDEQKRENGILGKRQQYLVKVLKEKDTEMEKIITWKRHIS